jgi:hypothetical protein
VEQQVAGLFGWKPENAMEWLVSNPEGPDEGQEEQLVQALKQASSPRGRRRWC